MGFLDSLLRMYNYSVLQSVKESLYYYNEEQIARDIQNYMFAVNFEPGTTEVCRFTGERLEISEAYLQRIESRLMVSPYDGVAFRASVQRTYTSTTLTQEILRDNLPITQTVLYQQLHERYIHNLKEKVLDPFLDNENFRRAVKEFDLESFKTYDQKIQSDVRFMMKNLQKKLAIAVRVPRRSASTSSTTTWRASFPTNSKLASLPREIQLLQLILLWGII